jgi:hypothetical protein
MLELLLDLDVIVGALLAMFKVRDSVNELLGEAEVRVNERPRV